MGNFGKSGVSNFSVVEVLVFILAVILVAFIAMPNVGRFFKSIKVNNAIDSVYSYKDSIDKYYIGMLMYDSSFKLDGKYNIVDGNLSRDEDFYNLYLSGNVPSEGYLEYSNNKLSSGCVLIDNYYIVIDETGVSVSDSNCLNEEIDVALN